MAAVFVRARGEISAFEGGSQVGKGSVETRKVGGFDASETSRKVLGILLDDLQIEVTGALRRVINPCGSVEANLVFALIR